jgi:hypothetical protein
MSVWIRSKVTGVGLPFSDLRSATAFLRSHSSGRYYIENARLKGKSKKAKRKFSRKHKSWKFNPFTGKRLS